MIAPLTYRPANSNPSHRNGIVLSVRWWPPQRLQRFSGSSKLLRLFRGKNEVVPNEEVRLQKIVASLVCGSPSPGLDSPMSLVSAPRSPVDHRPSLLTGPCLSARAVVPLVAVHRNRSCLEGPWFVPSNFGWLEDLARFQVDWCRSRKCAAILLSTGLDLIPASGFAADPARTVRGPRPVVLPRAPGGESTRSTPGRDPWAVQRRSRQKR